MKIIFALILTLAPAFNVKAVTISTVPVGNAGNPADTEVMSDGTSGYGSVSYLYRIGTTEVTNSQYVEFLNAVAASDPYALYEPAMGIFSFGGIVRSGVSGSFSYAIKAPAGTYTYDNKPVSYVTWYDAIRFANWLHNGQGTGDTETGAYTLLGGTPTPSNGNSITRNPGARWFLTSEDEWYKAAYYDPIPGIYYDYPTRSNTAPNNNLPSQDTGNSANSYTGRRNANYPMTDAGAYTLSASAYGTFDQAGNVYEWTESLVNSNRRVGRGGSFDRLPNWIHANNRVGDAGVFDFVGFRMATIAVPEPSAIVLLIAAFATLSAGRRGWHRLSAECAFRFSRARSADCRCGVSRGR